MNSDRVTAIMTMNNNTFNYSNRFNLIMEKNDCNTAKTLHNYKKLEYLIITRSNYGFPKEML